MKLSGTTALYTQLKELESAVAITKRQIALAEKTQNEGKAPAKVAKRKRRTKAEMLVADQLQQGKPNGFDEAEA